jgi:hypothetical protein
MGSGVSLVDEEGWILRGSGNKSDLDRLMRRPGAKGSSARQGLVTKQVTSYIRAMDCYDGFFSRRYRSVFVATPKLCCRFGTVNAF